MRIAAWKRPNKEKRLEYRTQLRIKEFNIRLINYKIKYILNILDIVSKFVSW